MKVIDSIHVDDRIRGMIDEALNSFSKRQLSRELGYSGNNTSNLNAWIKGYRIIMMRWQYDRLEAIVNGSGQ